ncbi:biopolymer transporter ExbD [Niveibacterium sp. 24ML]|uniref:ExbD/TolR family protein n=1 Tax=Niveibacterium sp. 24ML TaxID=2985512 RepID=UPI00226FAC69|nr:biopolymer transporter ExbD [Niveibacterium sp. 24ML]MCX9157145.1 biopolymer transporter ExbD [Niveibacterium sp. 24ML]
MNFRRGRRTEEVEINLIPLIDVMLVIIIFLMLTTTYSKYSGLEINLPTAASPATPSVPNEIDVIVSANGDVTVNRVPVGARDPASIAEALRRARPESDKEPVVIINADAKTPHQAVIDVMQAAQTAGLPQITFATQASQN